MSVSIKPVQKAAKGHNRFCGPAALSIISGIDTAEARKRLAAHGWWNWYFNRGRMVLGSASDRELRAAMRAVSWRRAF